METLLAWFIWLLRPVDVWLNTWLFWSPYYNSGDTISQHSAKASLRGNKIGCILCGFLHIFQRDHCARSLEHDHEP